MGDIARAIGFSAASSAFDSAQCETECVFIVVRNENLKNGKETQAHTPMETWLGTFTTFDVEIRKDPFLSILL